MIAHPLLMKIRLGHVLLTGVALAFFVCLLVLLRPSKPSPSASSTSSRETVNQSALQEVQAIREREARMNKTLWATEMKAQAAGRLVEQWWNDINFSETKLETLANIQPNKILVGDWDTTGMLRTHPIERLSLKGNTQTFSNEDWREWVTRWINEGWELVSIEFRHVKFKPTSNTGTYESEFYFRAALNNKILAQRLSVEGPLEMIWKESLENPDHPFRLLQCDSRKLELLLSTSPSPFEIIFDEVLEPPVNAHAIDPLLVQDLDGNGFSEIVIANKNLVLRLSADDQMESKPLCSFPPGLISTAVFSDLNNDGAVDFLCHKHEGLVVIPGSRSGEFDQFEIMLRPSTKDMEYPMVLSTGDIDRDGDQDIFIGQYRIPYESGSLPTPFWDANDGYPFFLLRNDGDLEFTDITESALPSAKRHRRIYSASLADMDGVHGPDLVIVSDFAGLDVYLNDGTGQFASPHPAMFGETLGFGMAHAFADFNADGRHDLLMIGMTSPTVDRLEHLGIHRPGLTKDTTARARLAHGNRLFVSTPQGNYEQNEFSASIERAGWAWGCSVADFDNDAYPDVYIGNGLESGPSVRDYESEYWLRDAFIADSEKNTPAYIYFKEKFAETRGKDQSYGGYESNRLFLNRNGNSFLDVGHLWGVGPQTDTRNVVTEDLNGDGRMDLLFIHYQIWPEIRESLRVYLNRMPQTGNWISFRPETGPEIPPPTGLQITIQTGNRRSIRELVNGDSYRSQHSQSIHFGLGKATTVERVEARWPDGKLIRLNDLNANRSYLIPYSDLADLNDKE